MTKNKVCPLATLFICTHFVVLSPKSLKHCIWCDAHVWSIKHQSLLKVHDSWVLFASRDSDWLSMFLSFISRRTNILKLIQIILFFCVVVIIAVNSAIHIELEYLQMYSYYYSMWTLTIIDSICFWCKMFFILTRYGSEVWLETQNYGIYNI